MVNRFFYILIVLFGFSCTSNTIFKEPADLIPKDTMSLILEEMMVASSGKFVINKNLEKNINYMPLVYKKYKIDSSRFQRSNLYYMSEIDLYEKIVTVAENSLKEKKDFYSKLKVKQDSIRKDSLKKIKIARDKLDRKDSLKQKKDSISNLKK